MNLPVAVVSLDRMSKQAERAWINEYGEFCALPPRWLSSPWQPVHRHLQAEPLRPGEIVPVDIALHPHATRFRTRDQLLLDIPGRWDYLRNPLTGQFPARYQQSPKATCLLHAGGTFEAYLLLASRPLK